MKKQLVLAVALFAAAAQGAPSALNPRYLVPAILGIQGEHLKLRNLLQNMAPQAADKILTKNKTDILNAINKQEITTFYDEANDYASLPMAAKYLLTYATPVGRRAPKGFHRTRMQQLASILNFVQSAVRSLATNHANGHKDLINSGANVVITALKQLPEIASRRALANRLSKTGKLVSSWSVPANMRGKKYLMFHGPVGYAIRNLPSLLRIVKNAVNAYQALIFDITASSNDDSKPNVASGIVRKLNAVLKGNTVHALPFLSLTTKYYMLESDYQKLPADDQVAVYQAVYEDVTDFSDTLVNVLAPRTTKANYDATVTWGKAAYANPKDKFAEAKDAAKEAAKAALDAAKKAPETARVKFNDFMARFQKSKP